MKYIFLSYSTKDSNTAYKLKGFLESDGFVVWMAPLGIPVGKKYPEIIESVIREAELFLLLASNNICKSNWIDKEVERAINYSRKLIIFKIDDCSYNDVFNFLLACVQCSEVIKDISLNDPAFARAYNDLKTLFDSDVPSKQIHIAKNDETSIKESGLSKEEQIREANNMVKAFMTSKEEVINALTPLHFKDVNKYVFHECQNLNEEQNKVIVDNLFNAYESVFLNPNISGRTEQAIKGQIIYYLTRLNKSNSGLIPKLKQFYYEESNIWIRQSIVYGLGALNEPTIPFEFAKKVYNEEDESLVNRSWTLCFYQDVCYIFFLAVSTNYRHQGYGGQIIEDIKASYPEHVILLCFEEIDQKYDNYVERLQRKNFYYSHGFIDNKLKTNEFGVIFETAFIGKHLVDFATYVEIFVIGFGEFARKHIKPAN